MTVQNPSLDEFRQEVQSWLESVAVLRPAQGVEWGHGDDSVVIFDHLTPEQEAELVRAGCAWERQRFDAGWGAISWPAEFGGRELSQRYAEVYDREEARFVTPRRNELFEVTKLMVAPTILVWGTAAQKDRFIRSFLRTDELCCQLFSEPGAGSDLAGAATRAQREGDGWVLSGQKVWTSCAREAAWGMAICRTDPTAPKHAGLTAFLVPMTAPGITIRPIQQMNGGASFNEVFFDGVYVDDECRLGPEGAGWKVAMTTLATERSASGSLGGGTVAQVIGLLQAMGQQGSAIHRQAVADLWIHRRIEHLNTDRVTSALESGAIPGPEGSIGRLTATGNLTRVSRVVEPLLGAKLTADTDEWGTYAWNQHVLAAPGYRIAGGTDEIQRNIIGERVLGLPREPR